MEMVCFLIQWLLDYLDKKGKILSMQTSAGLVLSLEKSRGEGSLMEQDIIENVS